MGSWLAQRQSDMAEKLHRGHTVHDKTGKEKRQQNSELAKKFLSVSLNFIRNTLFLGGATHTQSGATLLPP